MIVSIIVGILGFTLGAALSPVRATPQTVVATHTVTTPELKPPWCSGAQSKTFGQFVDDDTVPGSALYVEYRSELARMQGYGVQGTVDPGAILLTLALRCY